MRLVYIQLSRKKVLYNQTPFVHIVHFGPDLRLRSTDKCNRNRQIRFLEHQLPKEVGSFTFRRNGHYAAS